MIGIGHKFPDFSMYAAMPNGNAIELITNEHLIGDWAVIYFYPKDFTFICPTEISEIDAIKEQEIANVLGISGDNEYCKVAWKTSSGIIRNIQHPLAADSGLYLAHECGVVSIEGVCLRATFILDPYGTVQHASVNALDTGRNSREILRTVQALKAGGLTGCNWTPGDKLL